jgi:hypothetical protein
MRVDPQNLILRGRGDVQKACEGCSWLNGAPVFTAQIPDFLMRSIGVIFSYNCTAIAGLVREPQGLPVVGQSFGLGVLGRTKGAGAAPPTCRMVGVAFKHSQPFCLRFQ